jgi:hypothetical protein
MQTDRQNWALGPPQDLFRHGSKNEFPNSLPPARAYHDQVGVFLLRDCFDHSPNASYRY